MVVGVLRLTLVIAGARSLKDKRQALRKVIDRIRARFNVSIAEVGENDIWQRALIGITAVANDRSFINEVLDKVVSAVESTAVGHIANREMEIETYSEMQGDLLDKPMLEAPDWDLAAEEQLLREAGPAGAEGPAGETLPDEDAEGDQARAGWLREEDFK